MTYETQLSLEALTVGAVTLVTSNLIERLFPRMNSSVRLFLTGATIHLGFEYMGANEWYLENGASAIHRKTKICPSIRTSECPFTEWSSSECSVLEYS
jgi:hypothetical protein